MLGFLSRKKTAHPLAETKELDRVLAALPATEASAALDEVAAWSESLRALETFQADWLLGVLMRLDEVVRPHVRRLTRDYHGMPSGERSRQFRLWQIGRDHWREIAFAYHKGIQALPAGDKSLRPLACARALHAMRQLWKWNQYRYGPHEPDFWSRVGDLWLASNGVCNVPLFIHGQTESSVASELLKLVMLYASSTDSLLPLETEIAERLIDHFGSHFTLATSAEGMSHSFEPGASPRRLQQPLPVATPSLRYFTAGGAVEAMRALHLRLTASSELPRNIDLGAQYPVRVVLPVIEHLEVCWAAAAPERRFERFPVKSTADVVRGMAEVVQRLEDGGGEGQQTWLVRDLSRGGVRLAAPAGGNQWLQVGSLLAIRPVEANGWWLVVIRRMQRITEGEVEIGAETLSTAARPFLADSNGIVVRALLLDARDEKQHRMRVLVGPRDWDEGHPLVVEIEGGHACLNPEWLIERSSEYVIADYRLEPMG